MSVLRGAAVVLLSGAVLVALSSASRAVLRYDDSELSVLRLSWRVRGHHVEACRKLTAEELAKTPVHMRKAEICEGRMAPYHLRVYVDGKLFESAHVLAAGVRSDRPVYVFREYGISPGAHQLNVEFALVDSAATEGEAHVRDEPTDIDAPIRLSFMRPVSIPAAHVALITYDPDSSRLVLRTCTGKTAC